MESLFDRISEEIKKAMLAREKTKLEALRGIKKEFLEAKTEKGADGTLSDDKAIKILQKMHKQRLESAKIFQENGREELAADEMAQAQVIESYLPQMMTKDELLPLISTLLKDNNINDGKLKGKAIGLAQKAFSGKADGKLITEIVNQLLNN